MNEGKQVSICVYVKPANFFPSAGQINADYVINNF